jgi:hypothetical protein
MTLECYFVKNARRNDNHDSDVLALARASGDSAALLLSTAPNIYDFDVLFSCKLRSAHAADLVNV